MQAPAEVLVDVDVRSASRDGARGQPLDDGQTCGRRSRRERRLPCPMLLLVLFMMALMKRDRVYIYIVLKEGDRCKMWRGIGEKEKG